MLAAFSERQMHFYYKEFICADIRRSHRTATLIKLRLGATETVDWKYFTTSLLEAIQSLRERGL